MGMSAVQSSAFKAASGEMDISALHLAAFCRAVSLGGLGAAGCLGGLE